jgi:hypothetical protein
VSEDFARFLADRYDEAEALAQAAGEGDEAKGLAWHQEDTDRAPGKIVDGHGCTVVYDEGSPTADEAAFIASVDPAHRLADIKLKRAILALHHPDGGKWPDCKECSCQGALAATDCPGIVPWPCATARQLGTEFSGHPAYKEEWAAP